MDDILMIGDRVRFREWDDMKYEFCVSPWGSINCLASFTEEMRCLCGECGTVISVVPRWRGGRKEIYLHMDDAMMNKKARAYSISADMLEFEYDAKAFDIDEDISDLWNC